MSYRDQLLITLREETIGTINSVPIRMIFRIILPNKNLNPLKTQYRKILNLKIY